ncbi:MAG: PaeR7I family type II restriction endonuclease [Nitrospirae bacterium]|nr:PaeR7I family type II restriction endonuclease [Nitrospirota bacterium]
MSLDLADYKIKARSAVKTFWTSRKVSGTRKQSAGSKDQRKRSTGTSGGSMDGFIDLVVDVVHANGLPDADIVRKGRGLTLPGHFCTVKSWDVLVMNHGKLIAAIKFDAQVGPSFRKSTIISCDQALSLAVDLQAAYRRDTFGVYARPFVGYLCLIEDSPALRAPVKDISPNFPLVPEYRNASYAKRLKILCTKLMMDGFYIDASVILSPRSSSKSGAYSEMSKLTGLTSFVAGLAARVAMEVA